MKNIIFILLLITGISLPGQVDTLVERIKDVQEFGESVNDKIAVIRGQLSKVKQANSFVDKLSLENVEELPIALSKEIAGQTYTVLIQEAVIRPQGAFLKAAFVFEVPKTGDTLYFQAVDIPLTSGGLSSNSRMELLMAPPIRLSNKITLQLLPGTKVEWGCEGYKSLTLNGKVDFSTDLIVEDRPDGSAGTEAVHATFMTSFVDWNDFIAELSFSSAFQPACLKGLGISLTSAVLDMSEVQSGGSVQFPKEYPNDPLSKVLWQGIYIQDVEVRLPASFNKPGTSARKSFAGHNVLMDQNGLSGSFWANNIITMPSGDGSMSGWPFSVDSIGIDLAMNQIRSAGFKGEMNLPIQRQEKTNVTYLAHIYSSDHYLFNVALGQNLDMQVWSAELDLYPNSSIQIELVESKFLPKAVLHGEISVNKDRVELASVEFLGLELQTVAPYIAMQSISLETNSSKQPQGAVQNFPIHLNELGVERSGDLYGLRIGLELSLSEGTNGISAGGSATVFGKVEGGGPILQRFSYDHVQFNKFFIDANLKAVTVKGYLETYRENPVYGTGFKGSLEVSVIEKINVKATVQFGRKATYRYWYVDAHAVMPVGIPIATGVGIYGFSGGASRFMRRDASGLKALTDLATPSQLEDLSQEPGVSLSGIRFIPDSSVALMLKAGVIFGTTPSPVVANGKVELEVAFSTGGGINSVSLTGKAAAMAEIGSDAETAAIKIDLLVTYLVKEKTLDGICSFEINTPATEAHGMLAMHFDPSEWYLYIGRPEPNDRIYINLRGFTIIQAYICAGTALPPYPDLPAKVQSIAGSVKRDRNEVLLKGASGFCFGAYLEKTTGKKKAAIFFYELTAGGGFDLMVAKLGQEVMCNNTGSAPGWKGWYAMGGVYAFVQGAVGIYVEKFEAEYHIFDAALAAVIDGQFPNPAYMTGTIEGEYNILDGMISGHCRFKFETGQKCDLSGANALAGLTIIQSVTPETNAQAVSVFTAPRASFNMTIGKVFEMNDPNGGTKRFAARLDYVKILDGNTSLPGTYEWNEQSNVVAFVPLEILPPNKTLKVEAKIYFEEQTSSGWKAYLVNGKRFEEIKSTTFTSGAAPNFIPKENITYSYPIEGQMHFLKDEVNGGYIQLNIGQTYLLSVDESIWKQVLRVKTPSGQFADGSFSYNSAERRVYLNLPTMANEMVYQMSLLNIPIATEQSVSENLSTSTVQSTDGVNLKANTLSGDIERLKENSLLTYNFRTSKFNRFTDKLASLQTGTATNWVLNTGVSVFKMNLTSPELFDEFELKTTTKNKRLVEFVSGKNNAWFTEHLDPMLYGNYPLEGKAYTSRDTSNWGMPPLRAVVVAQENSRVLQASETTATPIAGSATIVYDLGNYVSEDFYSLRTQAANMIASGKSVSANTVLLAGSVYPAANKGSYPVTVKYQLPDGKISSQGSMVIINP
jgi:hypothetical protein